MEINKKDYADLKKLHDELQSDVNRMVLTNDINVVWSTYWHLLIKAQEYTQKNISRIKPCKSELKLPTIHIDL